MIELPQRKCAIKELRKNHARRLHNLDIKTDIKKTIKRFLSSVTSKNTGEAENTLKLIYKKMDKAAKRNIISKNTAARRKSRFSRLLATVKN